MNDKIRVSVFTLGCKTNLYESRQIITQLSNAGYDANEGLKEADVFIINTCAVTNEAERKSRQAVARCRKLNPDARILICGCAAEHNVSQFGEGVTFVKGTANKLGLVNKIFDNGTDREEIPSVFEHANFFAAHCGTRDFIKIQDGCDNFCSYCIVPFLRGRSRSRAVSEIVAEAEKSVAKEIVLTGVDISSYGKRGDGTDLAELCSRLAGIKARKRLGSLEQSVIDDRLLSSMCDSGFCPHFHISLQSGSEKVLKDMNRRYTPGEFLSTVEKIRDVFPLAGVTTDVIVGFPTESEANFQESLNFCERAEFSDLHVFPYSQREGTSAALLKTLDKKVVSARAAKMNELKQNLKKKFIIKNSGKISEILTEETEDGFSVGYTPNYIRVFLEERLPDDKLILVTLGEPFRDGCKSRIASESKDKIFT